MDLKFRDYYGRYTRVHDRTASGNVIIEIKTCNDLNQCRLKKDDDKWDIETDISLDEKQVNLLIHALHSTLQTEE